MKGMQQSNRLASLDKGTHARRTLRHAFRRVIVLDLRQQACVLCLAKTAPERPAVFEFSRRINGSWQDRRGRWAGAHQRG